MIVLKKRVLPQPTPELNSAGDCGACVIGGLFNVKSVKEVYNKFNNGEIQGFTRVDLEKIFKRSEDLLDGLITSVPFWFSNLKDQAFGNLPWMQANEWFDYIKMALEAGYYGVAQVNYKKEGAYSTADHVILICGARKQKVPLNKTISRIENQIFISCSARTSPDEEWIEVTDFLKNRGGFNCLLVKPKK